MLKFPFFLKALIYIHTLDSVRFTNSISATIKTKCGFPSETELDIFPSLKYFVSGILTLLTAVIGTLGNILSIVTLLHRLEVHFANLRDNVLMLFYSRSVCNWHTILELSRKCNNAPTKFCKMLSDGKMTFKQFHPKSFSLNLTLIHRTDFRVVIFSSICLRSMKNVFNHLLAVLCLVDLMVWSSARSFNSQYDEKLKTILDSIN